VSPLVTGYWRLNMGNETIIKTPDHTTKTLLGHYYAYYFIKPIPNISSYSYEKRFSSQWFNATKGTCVTFYYFMSGLTNNSTYLQFYIKKEGTANDFVFVRPQWSVYGEQGPLWLSHRFSVNSTVKWQIIFGTKGTQTSKGLIAIDDINIQIDTPCPPRGI